MKYQHFVKTFRRALKRHVPTVHVRGRAGSAHDHVNVYGSGENGMFTTQEREGLLALGFYPCGNCLVIAPQDRLEAMAKVQPPTLFSQEVLWTGL